MKQINFYFYFSGIMLLLVVIVVLISVAFLTLMERKLLSIIHIRKGPNKVGIKGILQPFSDAIKLMMKEDLMMMKFNYFYYYYSPIFMLILSLMMWMIYSYYTNLMVMNFGFIYLLCCFSIGGYGLFMSGWSSNSSYSMLGALRSLAQSISYEVSLGIIMICSFMMVNSLSFLSLNNNYSMSIYLMPLSVLFFFSMLAELNRTPFDFSEGESELVSGFNVEYGGGGFVLIFLSEYSGILLMGYLFVLFYMEFNMGECFFFIKIMSVIYLILWIRGCYPRFRYDLLMKMCWMMILPLTLNYFVLMLLFKGLIL